MAPLKTPFEEEQLCTTSTTSTSLGVRQHAFGRLTQQMPYIGAFFQKGFLDMPYILYYRQGEKNVSF